MAEPAGVKPPTPSPSRIATLLDPTYATARSGLPSRSKSPTATDPGLPTARTGEPAGCVKPPVPSPSRIVTLREPKFATARSGLPARSKSPTATDCGENPAPTGEPAGCVKAVSEQGRASHVLSMIVAAS